MRVKGSEDEVEKGRERRGGGKRKRGTYTAECR
jgi:hypothetical protein